MKPLRRRADSAALFGAPSGPERGQHAGVTFHTPGEATGMAKADKDGIYTLNGQRFRINAGDELPEGAVLDGDEPAAEKQDRARKGAPERKALGAAPENKSA